ncbi:MAG: DUF3429 domain-containing protein [Hyphomonadaceae bacterium]|nr:DUF3429 domain-containing protein [Hyphomonadaceae bacterium]
MRRRDLAPRGPWVLGILGLVPFYGAILAGQFAPPPYSLVSITVFYVYSAVILSFLGGTRWGFEVSTRPEGPSFLTLLFSVIPSLLALVGGVSQFVAPLLGLGILAAGFFAMWVWDYATTGGSTRLWPLWYRPLRTMLSVGALVAIALMAWLT